MPHISDEDLEHVLAMLGDFVQDYDRHALRGRLTAARRPTVTWTSPRPGLHLIDGAPIHCTLPAMAAAQLAAADPGRPYVRAADFTTPGCAYPNVALRAGLHRAADAMERHHRGLASVIRSMSVERGLVVCPPPRRLDIVAQV